MHGAGAGLAVLDALDRKKVAGVQSYHAARAHFLALSGALNAAAGAYETALALTPEPALRKFLQSKRSALVKRL